MQRCAERLSQCGRDGGGRGGAAAEGAEGAEAFPTRRHPQATPPTLNQFRPPRPELSDLHLLPGHPKSPVKGGEPLRAREQAGPPVLVLEGAGRRGSSPRRTVAATPTRPQQCGGVVLPCRDSPASAGSDTHAPRCPSAAASWSAPQCKLARELVRGVPCLSRAGCPPACPAPLPRKWRPCSRACARTAPRHTFRPRRASAALLQCARGPACTPSKCGPRVARAEGKGGEGGRRGRAGSGLSSHAQARAARGRTPAPCRALTMHDHNRTLPSPSTKRSKPCWIQGIKRKKKRSRDSTDFGNELEGIQLAGSVAWWKCDGESSGGRTHTGWAPAARAPAPLIPPRWLAGARAGEQWPPWAT